MMSMAMRKEKLSYKRGAAEPGDYDVDDKSNDKARYGQVTGDVESSGESDGVHGYKKGVAEPGDYDVNDESNHKARDGQLIGEGENDGDRCCKKGVAEPGDCDVDDDSNDKARDVQVLVIEKAAAKAMMSMTIRGKERSLEIMMSMTKIPPKQKGS